MCSYAYMYLLSFSLFSKTQKVEMISKFYEYEKYACIYYAYNTIQKYLVSCLYELLEVGVHWFYIIHDSYVLKTVYLHSSLLLCVWIHHVCNLHDSCVLEHYVYIFHYPCVLCTCSVWFLCVGTNYVHILHDFCELMNSVFAFLLILICLHSHYFCVATNCVSVLHDLCVGTQRDCFVHDSFVLEHSAFGYL